MIPKSLWPQAFSEAKKMSDHCLELNQKAKKFIKQKPDGIPTDRELTLSAGIQIFWQFKIAQEASNAARILIWQRVESFINKHVLEDESARRLLKNVRRLKNQDGENGFLILWEKVEAFLWAGSDEKFWKQTTKSPWELISDLANELEITAKGANDDDESQTQESEAGDRPGGEIGPQGGNDSADQGSMLGSRESSSGDSPGANGG